MKKAYTDIEQSKKLAKILPLESADMKYPYFGDGQYGTTALFGEPIEFSGGKDIPCWSLTALLNVIKPINENTYTIRGTLDGGAIISFDEVTSVMFQEEEIIDAVFEMVVWLKEIEKL